jgi:hypothetical protein
MSGRIVLFGFGIPSVRPHLMPPTRRSPARRAIASATSLPFRSECERLEDRLDLGAGDGRRVEVRR